MARKSVAREPDGPVLRLLYGTVPGRLGLKVLISRRVSDICGKFMDSPLSACIIKSFIKKNHIRMSDYENRKYASFNDFFTRKIKNGKRPVYMESDALIAPCDGLLSAYRIKSDTVIPVKHSSYSLERLLDNKELAKEYRDGICLVFRLCVDNYHRYCYIDRGRKGENHFIPGVLHTVRPIALEKIPVFTENCREYTVIDTNNFGRVVQMEVGAMLVGKICNHHGRTEVYRGQEKGLFLYGGSTVILLIKNDTITMPEYVFEATKREEEIPVRMGERIAKKIYD